ncbi:MAG: Asp-tRNA(Asn)/Glu-tRNA(Gln) amidotransferase subunit GatB [Anaerolineales bacterium]
MIEFEPVIGLEVHAEMLTESKMFCGCAVVDATVAAPNDSVCEICTGMPGTLPVINRRAVEYALRVATALDCTIAETSVFARKNYFYPDLPKGFQISQYELPLARHGRLPIETETGEKEIRIRRVHLEEDTGKLFHRNDYSLIDFNRSGVPLLEIVSEPDLRSVEEAYAYITGLRRLLRYLEVNSGDMEKGVIRFEANVSLRPVDDEAFGTRVEIKNLNSFRAVTRSLEHELERQRELLTRGESVTQATLGWDESKAITVVQRIKEQAEDYRYFPEPDLPPLVVSQDWISRVRLKIPELPHIKSQRFIEAYGLTEYTVGVLIEDRIIAEYFEAAAEATDAAPADKLANWLTGDYFALLNEAGISLEESLVPPDHLAELVDLVEAGTINATTAKEVLAEAFESGESPAAIVADRGLEQQGDPAVINKVLEDVLRENPEQLQEYLAGKEAVSQWFFGQIMRATKGQADPQVVRSVLTEKLAEIASDVDTG